MKIILDGKKMRERGAAHCYLKSAMNFPDYYGENLDSLYDCLSDICDKTQVIIKDSSQADTKILDIFLESQSENQQLILEFRD